MSVHQIWTYGQSRRPDSVVRASGRGKEGKDGEKRSSNTAGRGYIDINPIIVRVTSIAVRHKHVFLGWYRCLGVLLRDELNCTKLTVFIGWTYSDVNFAFCLLPFCNIVIHAIYAFWHVLFMCYDHECSLSKWITTTRAVTNATI